ncbi:MAG: DUF6438 domain-containing protein [Sphingomonas sp.]
MRLSLQAATLAFLFAPGCGSAQEVPTIGFGAAIGEHRLSGNDRLEIDGLDRGTFSGISVRVTVGTDGSVIDARMDRDGIEKGDARPALAAVRQWKFHPFEYRGRPVRAVGTVSINYVPKGRWADPQADFPAIDYATLRIELQRSACYGNCPDYSVAIDGAGNVTFSTRAKPVDEVSALHRAYNANGVLVPGTHRTKIDRATLDALIGKFRTARFFGLEKNYSYPVTDNPTHVLRFSTGGRTMEVADYVGRMAGMPAEAYDLEAAVDAAAGTARWVTGDATTLAALVADGFDPRSREAARLAVAALGESGDALVLDLIAAGLPLDAVVKDPRGATVQTGVLLQRESIRFGRAGVARALAARGWLAKVPAAERAQLFAESAGGCDPDVARAMVESGVDPNAQSKASHDMGFTGGGNALNAAVASYGTCRDIDRAALVKALLALGVDPNARNADGESPIFGLEDRGLLDLLLANGAKVGIKDKAGRGPVFGTWTDVIALTLLDAGADPRGKDEGGKTLRQVATQKYMPATLAWLDAHGIP